MTVEVVTMKTTGTELALGAAMEPTRTRLADDPLVSLLVQELERRGMSQPHLWAEVLSVGGVEEAAQRFSILMAEVLNKARDELHQKSVMNNCWRMLVSA